MTNNITEKAAGATNTNGPLNLINDADCGTTSPAPSLLITRLQAAGYAIHQLVAGDLMASKYGQSHYYKDVSELVEGVKHEF